MVPEVRLDVLVEVRISIGVEFVLSIQSSIVSKVPLCEEKLRELTLIIAGSVSITSQFPTICS